jgi:hypothetical protein
MSTNNTSSKSDQNNNFPGISSSQTHNKTRSQSQKPHSAQSKNRIRSNSPSAQAQQERKQQKMLMQQQQYSQQIGLPSQYPYSNMMGGSKQINQQPLYRGYSPSKPKWKGQQNQMHMPNNSNGGISNFVIGNTVGGQQNTNTGGSALMSAYLKQTNSTKNKYIF